LQIVLAFLFCSVVPDLIKTHNVDVIETNHVVSVTRNKDGTWSVSRHISQLIFWELKTDGEFRVRDWRMLKDTARPTFDHNKKMWLCRWFDRGVAVREVLAPAHLETYTIIDPEVADRQDLPVHRRRKFGD